MGIIKMAIGGGLLVAGLFLSFIPPFFLGLPVMLAGWAIGFKGMFDTGVGVAKAGAAGTKAVMNYRKEKDLAERERALLEREQQLNQANRDQLPR
jgi:hypothetical protein